MPTTPDQTKPADARAPRAGLYLMALILIALALVSAYSNYERAHTAQIEKVTIKPATANSPAPEASPAGE